MAPRKKTKSDEDENLTETERIILQQKVAKFLNSNDEETEFQGLNSAHRKYIHKYAAKFSLKSHSYGKGTNRVLCLKRRKPKAAMGELRTLKLSNDASRLLDELEPSINNQLKVNFNYNRNFPKFDHRGKKRLTSEVRQLSLGQRMVPPHPNCQNQGMLHDKRELPIFRYKNQLHQMLNQYSVFIVNGETGSGKTTQVPQFILEEAANNNKPCRIVVSQPRRVGAVSVATRVAEERGEQLGDAVGYQIRMESQLRKTTNLIYTTSGCLLRSIMAGTNEFFQRVTHLIIDEIHERDKYTDFALITIKEQLRLNKDLKVILMSATMDIELLSNYFDNCPTLNVPGQGYDVKIYHLEDILYHTGYRTSLMEKYLRSMNEMPQTKALATPTAVTMMSPLQNIDGCAAESSDENHQEILNLLLEQFKSDTPRKEDDLCEMFDQLQYYIESEGMPVDAAHSQTGLTPLMAACKFNCPQYVQRFLAQKANVMLRDSLGNSASDYAQQHVDGVCLRVLQSQSGERDLMSAELAAEEKERQTLLKAYQKQFNDDYEVDHDLILSLLEGLYRSPHPGAIMVFLPGYNDIIQQRDLIESTLPNLTYRICILHGQMDSRDQYDALQPMLVRKIVLSTNIGQTSITIPDLAYIIDSGKVKMNMFDSITESSQLQSVWISQADACQRAGRAGRTQNGVCYRLYTREKYKYMPTFCIPEFLRIPLTEICLFAKTLAPQQDVQQYLARALNPPSTLSIQNAIKKLQILEVFNSDESVTDLGLHLVDIPLDVQLGKCLLYGVFFKCCDPILTIVAFHSVKDPFVLPSDRSAQGQASFQRKLLSGDSFSDQMGILELYRGYMAVRGNRKRSMDYCTKYALSHSAMEVFCSTRRQIADVISAKFRLRQYATQFNHDWNMVRLCLAAGFYPNVAFLDRNRCALISGAEKQLILQRASSLNPPGKKHIKEFIDQLPHDWILFYEKSRVGNVCAINMNTVVPPIFIALQCGNECKLDSEAELSDVSNEGSADEDDEPPTPVYNPLLVWKGPDAEREMRSMQSAFESITLKSNEKTVVMALDNWIKFAVRGRDAEQLMNLRKLIRKQFLLFLQRGQVPETTSGAFLVQKLLFLIDRPHMRHSQSVGNSMETKK